MTPWTVAHQAPLSMGFSRQEYWSGLPCPLPGDLPDPGIKPVSLLHWQAGSLPRAPPGKTHTTSLVLIYFLTGSSNLLVTFVQFPHLLVITNLISFFSMSLSVSQAQLTSNTMLVPGAHHSDLISLYISKCSPPEM